MTCSNCEAYCDGIIGAVDRCCECLGMSLDFCQTCADRMDRESERAYERQCENFYGGGSPVTLDEQHAAAWEEKRRLR